MKVLEFLFVLFAALLLGGIAALLLAFVVIDRIPPESCFIGTCGLGVLAIFFPLAWIGLSVAFVVAYFVWRGQAR